MDEIEVFINSPEPLNADEMQILSIALWTEGYGFKKEQLIDVSGPNGKEKWLKAFEDE